MKQITYEFADGTKSVVEVEDRWADMITVSRREELVRSQILPQMMLKMTSLINYLLIDIETYSSVDLSKCGVFKYSESSDFKVLLFGYSINGEEVQVVDLASGEPIPHFVISALKDDNVTKYAYNASFERVCLSRYLGLSKDEFLNPASWKCHMVWSAYLGLPLSLKGVGKVLNLDSQKMEEGNLDTLVDTAGKIVMTLLDGMISALPKIAEGALKLALTLVEGLISNLPKILGAGIQMVVTFAEGIAESLPELVPAVASVVAELVNTLIAKLPKILNAGLKLVTGLAQGIIKAIPVLVAALPKIITSIVDFIMQAIPEIIEAGITLFTSLIAELPTIIESIVEAIPVIIEGIVYAVMGNIPILIEAGISYDLAGIAVTPFSLVNVTPTQAIEKVLSSTVLPHSFKFRTDYSSTKDFNVEKPKSVRACLGGAEGSLLNQWGGEFEWDNFNIIHHQKRGSNNGVVIEYGKNLTKLEQDSDLSDVYTDLLPYAVFKDDEGNDKVITLAEQLIPISTTLEKRKSLIKDFSDSFKDGEKVDEEKLIEKAKEYLENNPLGIENPTINISFEALWKQPDYVAILERVSLCDTVLVKHSELGVYVKTKVIKTIYDSLLEKYTSITLGSSKANLVDRVTNINEEVRDSKKSIERIPSLIKSAVSTASKTITGNAGGHVVLHSADDGEPYELLIMDTDSIETAVNVWRWNVSGLGFSKNGYNGPYETAITGDGSIVADFITSGTLLANVIKAGILSSNDGSSYWNLETGDVMLKAYATNEKVDGKVSEISLRENRIESNLNGLTSTQLLL